MKIDWVKKEFDFYNLPCELDMAKTRLRQGTSDHIDFLNMHVATAVNYTFSNNNFAKYLKKNIVGKWTYEDFAIEFDHTGQYKIKHGQAPINPIFFAVSNTGKYYFSKNMMFLQGKNLIELRTQIVDLVNEKLILPGIQNSLSFILQKEYLS